MLKLGSATLVTAAAACLIPAAPAAGDPWGTPHCNPGWSFVDIEFRKTKQLVAETSRVENPSRKKIDATFTSTKSVTAGIGVQYTAPVPARKTAVGTYGVFVRPVKGTLQKGNKYSRCIVRKRIKVKVPAGTGWRHRYEPL